MKKQLLTLGLAALFCLPMSAQDVKLMGVAQSMRTNDNTQLEESEGYIGWCQELNGGVGASVYLVRTGIYSMTWDGSTLSTPVHEPNLKKSDVVSGGVWNLENAQAVFDWNQLYGNSGSVYIDGKLVTIFSRDESSTTDEELFKLRWWDAKTGKKLYDTTAPKSLNAENAGLSYNMQDGKVYGLFYLTEAQLPEDITSDPEYFESEADPYQESSGTDAGYCLCEVDLKTMTITPITPGLYYQNFVAFAINSEGRAFGITSGGAAGYVAADGKQYNMDNQLSGAQVYEFDLATGMYYANATHYTDESGEDAIDYTPCFQDGTPIPGTGYSSQYRTQSACFAKSNPNMLYWNGYYNSGKGYNDWGSWGSLSDKEWKTNHKFDTCLYGIDITTGECTRLASIPNRFTFSCLWVDGDDCSDGSGLDIVPDEAGIDDPVEDGISRASVKSATSTEIFNISGQRTNGMQRGINIVKNGSRIQKVVKK
jgi:hypothetical protein